MRLDRQPIAVIATAALVVGAGANAATSVGQSTGARDGSDGSGPRSTVARTSIVAPSPRPTGTPAPTATPKPTSVPTPTPEPIPKEPVCKTGAASHGGKPQKLRARILRLDGVVEIRGSRTQLTVEACAGRNAFPSQEFTLLKAPKTSRFVAVMTARPVRQDDGTISYVFADYARPRTEAKFRKLIPRPEVTLRLPGVKGVVFAPSGTPLDLLATHRNGTPVPQELRQKLAKAYLLTGGTA